MPYFRCKCGRQYWSTAEKDRCNTCELKAHEKN